MAEEKNIVIGGGELVINCDRFSNLKHSTVCPFAFTEQGVAMLASVLRSETAIRVSIRIMNAFVSMRHFLINNADVFRRLSTIEYHQLEMMQHQQESDKRIDEVFHRSHDRFLCIDDVVYHIGASIKNLGKKWFAFAKMEVLTLAELVAKINESHMKMNDYGNRK